MNLAVAHRRCYLPVHRWMSQLRRADVARMQRTEIAEPETALSCWANIWRWRRQCRDERCLICRDSSCWWCDVALPCTWHAYSSIHRRNTLHQLQLQKKSNYGPNLTSKTKYNCLENPNTHISVVSECYQLRKHWADPWTLSPKIAGLSSFV